MLTLVVLLLAILFCFVSFYFARICRYLQSIDDSLCAHNKGHKAEED